MHSFALRVAPLAVSYPWLPQSVLVYIGFLAVLYWAYKCVHLLRKNERGVIMRLGRFIDDCLAPRGPGFVLILWPADLLVRWRVAVGDENLIGKQGVWRGRLTKEQLGIVEIDGQDWGAVAGRDIPLGQNVCVAGMEGMNLVVEVGPNAKSPETLLDEEIERQLKLVKLVDDKNLGSERSVRATAHLELAKLYERKGDAEAARRHTSIAEKLEPNIRESFPGEQGKPS
jgi:hypothetical protein